PLLHVAPLNTPLQARLETLGVIWHIVSIPVFACSFLGFLSLGWVFWLVVILPYFIWWYGFDLHTPTNGKAVYRARNWIKNFIVWEWFVNYFPIRVHKTCELEPTFTDVLVESEEPADDEEDLISEDSRTLIDKIFKKLGLSKRLNDIDSSSPPPGNSSSLTPTKLKKYKRLSTGPRYIFGYHPHGVISMGAMGAFATNALRNEPYEPPMKWLKPFFHDPSKGERILPGLGNVFPLTLTTQFTIPFYRDYLLGLGLSSASAKNIKSLINNGDNSICLVVGGAQESLLNDMVTNQYKVGYGYKDKRLKNPDKTHHIDEKPMGTVQGDDTTIKIKNNQSQTSEEQEELTFTGKPVPTKRQIQLVLNKRKGFVKLAIELGNVCLVPVFAFGEVDIYKLNIPKPGSWGYTFQRWMKSTFLFTLPFFSARGVFIYDFGIVPYRNPINICLGKPIHIPANCLADYKAKHPEFENLDAVSSTDPNHPDYDLQKVLRSRSITNLFKINNQPKKSSVKTKIPPELLDRYHKLYIDELKRVYEDNKERFGYGDVELVIKE
ncbi:DAGAT-domain-containing protein, partial [Suhomyces tanzawaensis NRRL Y-17324]